MNLDLRIPMGLMFTFTGAIMTTWGIKSNGDVDLYAKSLGINANLWWGLVLLVFGRRCSFLVREASAGLRKSRLRRWKRAKCDGDIESREQGLGNKGLAKCHGS